ncbi:MAG: hypothetical protein AAF718_12465 [Pseudomonadota bacterium]
MLTDHNLDDPYQVLPSERGVVRIFTTELDAEGNAAVTKENVHLLLGEKLDLDDGRIEVFPSTVIEEMGLSAYLHEGYGIPKDDLKGVAAALDQLKGLVILVSSAAFKYQAATLNPKSAVRLVGVFREPRAMPPSPMPQFNSSEGVLQTESPSTLGRRRGDLWPFALILIVAIVALVLLLVF